MRKQGKLGLVTQGTSVGGTGKKNRTTQKEQEVLTPVTMLWRDSIYERQGGYVGEGLREEMRRRLDVEEELSRLMHAQKRQVEEPVELRELLAAHLILEEQRKRLGHGSRISAKSPPQFSPIKSPKHQQLPTPTHHNTAPHPPPPTLNHKLSQSLIHEFDEILVENSRLRTHLLLQTEDFDREIRASSAGKELQRSRAKHIAKTAENTVGYLRGQITQLTQELVGKNTELEGLTKKCAILEEQKQQLAEELQKQAIDFQRRSELNQNHLTNTFWEKQRTLQEVLMINEKVKIDLQGQVQALEAKVKVLNHEKSLSEQKNILREQQLLELKEKIVREQRQYTTKIQQALHGRNRTVNQSQLTNKVGKPSTQTITLIKHYQAIIKDLRFTHQTQIAVFEMEIERLKSVIKDRDQQFSIIVQKIDNTKPPVALSSPRKTTDATLFEILMDKYRTPTL